jgi:uncharacterized protein YukE
MSGALIIQRAEIPNILSGLSSAQAEFEGGIAALPGARDSLLSGNTPLGQAEQQIQDGLSKITSVMDQLATAVQTQGGAQFTDVLQDWNRVVNAINSDIAEVQQIVRQLGEKVDELKQKLDQNKASLETDVSVFKSYLERMVESDHL